MFAKKVLICGGGVASDAFALLLSRLGLNVTVVQPLLNHRTPDFTSWHAADHGPNFHVRSSHDHDICFAQERDYAGACRPNEGSCRHRTKSLTSIKTMKADLKRLLHDKAVIQDEIRYIFNLSVRRLQKQQSHTTVTFSNGFREDFDLVVRAGHKSSQGHGIEPTFSRQGSLHHLGVATSHFTVPVSDLLKMPVNYTIIIARHDRIVMLRRKSFSVVQAYMVCPRISSQPFLAAATRRRVDADHDETAEADKKAYVRRVSHSLRPKWSQFASNRWNCTDVSILRNRKYSRDSFTPTHLSLGLLHRNPVRKKVAIRKYQDS